MTRTIGILTAVAILVCVALVACGGEASIQNSMMPQEVAQAAERTGIGLEEFSRTWDSITASLEQMSQEQLAEVFAAIALPEDPRGLADLRMAVLMLTTDHISANVIETWRHKMSLPEEVKRTIGRIFTPHPFLLQAVIDQTVEAAEEAESRASQMEEGEDKNTILSQVANLYTLAGNCGALMAHLLASAPQGSSPGTPALSY